MTRQVVYLHGFASSAGSSKARFFQERLTSRGVGFSCPDFNEPDFGALTVSRMLGQLAREMKHLPRGPVALIGSSLGAFVAVQAAITPRADPDHPIDRLILLAPALDFSLKDDPTFGGATFEKWRATGTLDVFHYGYGEMRSIGFSLYTDAQQYDPLHATFSVPSLVVQGRRDESVNPDVVKQFAAARPNVTLHLVDDGHQLLNSLDFIWDETVRFLDLD